MAELRNGWGSIVNNPRDSNSTFFNALRDLNGLIKIARVIDIIIDDQHENFTSYDQIGTIYFQLIDQATNTSTANSPALPLNPNIKNYPLINKEFEKENIQKAYGSGIETMRKCFSVDSHIPLGAEQYYNETFKK